MKNEKEGKDGSPKGLNHASYQFNRYLENWCLTYKAPTDKPKSVLYVDPSKMKKKKIKKNFFQITHFLGNPEELDCIMQVTLIEESNRHWCRISTV